jgi:hypothetical protein
MRITYGHSYASLEDALDHSVSNSRVITREYGDIPGCTPAVDVFIAYDSEFVREFVSLSADRYVSAIRKYNDGGFDGNGTERLQRMWEQAHSFDKLVFIRNPSKPYFTF